MRPLYENVNNNLEIYVKRSAHISPHLHKSLECVYVTKGSLEIGIAEQLYHMEAGDFGIVFPELIHHYQVFDTSECEGIYLLSSPSLTGPFLQKLQGICPDNPVISSTHVHEDIIYALKALLKEYSLHQAKSLAINQAFVQIILARVLPQLHLIEKSSYEGSDIVYQIVSYISGHFADSLTLTKMAHDLGVSQYAISRIFSSVFHSNFNQYINEIRLEHACNLLHYTNESITEIYENAGFESQRTFNRVFLERYHMSPRAYRQQLESVEIQNS